MTAKPLMIQGTMSGAGKSLLVAGLARVFAQDGYRVAPFKSQNMALNSAITADGFEMGRAQVVQAEAAGIPPEVAMNPILLKPTTDVGSQVIVNGVARATMSAREYFAYKHELIPDIMAAYNDLESRFDIVLIEGAGSPAEVNLKDEDIVNMGMAKMANSPVLLVGNIDPGGVFAQLIGTMMLLDPDERAMVKATIVNKFRGDKSILEPGLDILREKCGVPVAGVIPYADLDIDDEDSLSTRFSARTSGALVDIAVMRLPRVSNFTDFIALSAVDGVGVRYVVRASELGRPDLVIIPGTKSTMADLRWMRETGLETAVLKLAAAGVPVIGICGGYQMLGETILDPTGVEGGGEMRGMGLLPIRTIFEPEKRTVRSSGRILEARGILAGLTGAAISGYEIHMGKSVPIGCASSDVAVGEGVSPAGGVGGSRGGVANGVSTAAAFVELSAAGEEPHAAGCQAGNVYGTYLHGLFDSAECAKALVECLLAAKGLDASAVKTVDMDAHKNEQYDRLADVIRENMDMELVYRILEEGL